MLHHSWKFEKSIYNSGTGTEQPWKQANTLLNKQHEIHIKKPNFKNKNFVIECPYYVIKGATPAAAKIRRHAKQYKETISRVADLDLQKLRCSGKQKSKSCFKQ